MKRIIGIFIFIISILPTYGQDITSVFLSVPESLVYGLDAEAKDKLVANPKDSVDAKAESLLGGEITRLAITDDFIMLQTSQTGTLQIKLLPLINNSKIICAIKTVCGKACDSYVQFYTTDWKLLSDVGLLPKIDADWFIKPEVDKNNFDFINAFAAVDMTFFKLELNATEPILNVYFDIKNHLSSGEYKGIEPFLYEKPKTLTWDKVSFK